MFAQVTETTWAWLNASFTSDRYSGNGQHTDTSSTKRSQQMQIRKNAVIFCFGSFLGICTSLLFLRYGLRWYSGYGELQGKLNLFEDGDGQVNNVKIKLETELSRSFTDTVGKQWMMYSYGGKGEEVAKTLADEVRVLCWVLTSPNNHKTKAAAVWNTWGKRCNILLFMSSDEESSLPVVKLNVSEGREHLFEKTKEAMKYVYKYYLDQVEWILKADDDTFVIVENLRSMLKKYDPQEPLYMGCRFKPFVKQGFMSGGAGYVLSRKALKILSEKGIGENGECLKMKPPVNGEDVLIGMCLEMLNVTAVDTRDDYGRGRFFPYGPSFHLFPDYSSPAFLWYWDYQYYPNLEGIDCCSDTAVSFHYISPRDLYILNYLVYGLRPYGIRPHL